ncbi:MAG: double zinc ribbon domain-containing protein [Clostridium sp.]|nr:double zinc ribbon domain-containing protein [Clostridium sp.]
MVFPRRCPVCDEIVRPFGAKICKMCEPKLRRIREPWCMKCGKKLHQEEEYCADCRRRRHRYIRGRALYEYDSVAASVYRFKYGKRREYAEYFGEEMSRQLGGFIRQIKPDALIPIPLHKKRMQKRGYNQAALLAKKMGDCLGVPVYDKLLLRVKNTMPLKRQNLEERQNNLKRAFNMAQNDVKLNTIIIIDDIYTTGSTIDEAAYVLQAAGISRIYFITLACGAGI